LGGGIFRDAFENSVDINTSDALGDGRTDRKGEQQYGGWEYQAPFCAGIIFFHSEHLLIIYLMCENNGKS
jgi:hypothetical protein